MGAVQGHLFVLYYRCANAAFVKYDNIKEQPVELACATFA